MKKILLPTDFSEGSQNALDFTIQLAKKTGAEIDLFHVLETYATTHLFLWGTETQVTPEQTAYMAALRRIAEQRLTDTLSTLTAQGIAARAYTQEGNFYNSVSSKIAEKTDFDLVVIGTHQTTEEYLGVHMDKLVRYSKCPVLSIKQPTQLDTLKKIVFATSLAQEEQGLPLYVAQWQKLLGAEVHIVYINHPGNIMSDRQIRKQAAHMVQAGGIQDYHIHSYTESDVEQGIIYFAEDIKADLIMMGTHGRTGLNRLLRFKGSIAEGVATHTALPVWTMSMLDNVNYMDVVQ